MEKIKQQRVSAGINSEAAAGLRKQAIAIVEDYLSKEGVEFVFIAMDVKGNKAEGLVSASLSRFPQLILMMEERSKQMMTSWIEKKLLGK